MGRICRRRIQLEPSGLGTEKIQTWMDITKEKAPSTVHCWSRSMWEQTDGVIEKKESHPLGVRHQGPSTTEKFLTLEGGWYRCCGL